MAARNTQIGEACRSPGLKWALGSKCRRQALLLGLALTALGPAPGHAAKIDFSAQAIAFGQADMPRHLGRLEFLSAHQLNSGDSRFGGFSGLRFLDGGSKLVTISDRGRVLVLAVTRKKSGAIAKLRFLDFFPLRDDKLASLSGTLLDGDAESLAHGPGNSLLVGFERRHRILHYDKGILAGPGRAFLAAKRLPAMAFNKGLETLLRLPKGGHLAIAEQFNKELGGYRGFRLKSGKLTAFIYRTEGDYRPVDGMALKNGALLILERYFQPPFTIASRIVEIRAKDVTAKILKGKPVGQWGTERIGDNFEGLAIVDWRGKTLVQVISDDNFNFYQGIFLITFRLH